MTTQVNHLVWYPLVGPVAGSLLNHAVCIHRGPPSFYHLEMQGATVTLQCPTAKPSLQVGVAGYLSAVSRCVRKAYNYDRPSPMLRVCFSGSGKPTPSTDVVPTQTAGLCFQSLHPGSRARKKGDWKPNLAPWEAWKISLYSCAAQHEE